MKTEVIYMTNDQATELVDRIAERCEQFDHFLVDSEKEAMAQLLSDIGVKVDDILDVSNLADNYSINAELVGPDDADNYSRSTLEDALFTWTDNDNKYYCIKW